MTTPCPVIWKFAPQVTTIPGTTTPSTVAPTFALRSDVVLTFPYTSPTTTLTIPMAPAFGDSRVVTVESVRNSSMNGILTTVRNPLWPTIEIFTYTFASLEDEMIDDYFDFVESSLGLEIGLRDHRNQNWRGFILNPDGVSSQEQNCDSNLSLSFRGVWVS